MERITRLSRARCAAAAWRIQYPEGRYPDKEVIYAKLVALGPTPDPDEVDRVIGNGSWTQVPECDACGAGELPVVVEIVPRDYVTHLCGDCCGKAAALAAPQP